MLYGSWLQDNIRNSHPKDSRIQHVTAYFPTLQNFTDFVKHMNGIYHEEDSPKLEGVDIKDENIKLYHILQHAGDKKAVCTFEAHIVKNFPHMSTDLLFLEKGKYGVFGQGSLLCLTTGILVYQIKNNISFAIYTPKFVLDGDTTNSVASRIKYELSQGRKVYCDPSLQEEYGIMLGHLIVTQQSKM
jgi:hypothetical protein